MILKLLHNVKMKICLSCNHETNSLWKCLCKKCYMIDYREKNKEILKQKTKEYKNANPEKVKQWKSAWSKTQKGKSYINNYLKEYRAQGKTKAIESSYRNNHKEEILKTIENWRLRNLDKRCFTESNRRAMKLNATPIWFDEIDEFVLQEAHSLAKLREKSTGIKWHVDHVIPLKGRTVCGLHCWNNLQVIPAKHNLQKSNSFERN